MQKFKVGDTLTLRNFSQGIKTYKIIRVEELPYHVKDPLPEKYEDPPDPTNIAYVLECGNKTVNGLPNHKSIRNIQKGKKDIVKNDLTAYFWYDGKRLRKLAFHKDGDDSYYYPLHLQNYFLVPAAGSNDKSNNSFKF